MGRSGTAVAAALRVQTRRVHEEQGCLAIEAYSALRDPRLFYIRSRWTDEAAFGHHAVRPLD